MNQDLLRNFRGGLSVSPASLTKDGPKLPKQSLRIIYYPRYQVPGDLGSKLSVKSKYVRRHEVCNQGGTSESVFSQQVMMGKETTTYFLSVMIVSTIKPFIIYINKREFSCVSVLVCQDFTTFMGFQNCILCNL